MRFYIIVGVSIICFINETFAQRTYKLNHEGSECYFSFISYSKSGEYDHHQPIIFVVADDGEPAQGVLTTLRVIRKETLNH